MKLSDGFDARRLRDRQVTRWRWACLGVAFIILIGLAFAALGALALLGNVAQLEELGDSPVAALSLLLCGLLVIFSGLMLRRRSRRRLQSTSLSLAPHLLRK